MKKPQNKSLLGFTLFFIVLFAIFCVASALPQEDPNLSFKKKESPDIVLEGLAFRYVSEGKTIWNLKAKKGILHESKLTASLDNIELQTVPKGISTDYLLLKAPQASYNIGKAEILTQEPRSVLFLKDQTIQFQSSQIFINLKDYYLRSHKPVKLEYGNYTIQADSLFYDLNKNTLKLDQNFKITYD